MPLLAWIMLGLLTALVASKTINKARELRALDLLIGIAGGIFGGYAFKALTAAAPVAFSLRPFRCRSRRRAFLAMYRAIFRPQ